jgi:hypothetical protein
MDEIPWLGPGRAGGRFVVNLSEFSNPPSEYRVMPFWFWNSRLQKDELLEQIEDMHEHGIGGFFIHARFGLETEYLSEEWFDLVRACVEKAAEFSMHVWIYDENPFPSGIGGLKVSSQRKHRNRYVECIEQPLTAGSNRIEIGSGDVLGVRLLMPEGPAPLTNDGQPSGAPAIECAGQDSARVAVYVERVLESPGGKHFGINYLNPEAVKEFIEITHEKYREHLGDHFGKTIKGFFTDEPTLLPWHQDLAWYIMRGDGRVVAWSEEIPKALEDKHGYSLDEVLDAIFFGHGERSGEVRRDFWALVASLYGKSFFAAYRDWCHRHGLRLTGHVLLEEGLYFNTVFQGNIMKALEHMDMPGVDHLTSTAEQPGIEFMVGTAAHLPKVKTNVQGQKLVASSAHLSGKVPVISESFGIGLWGMTLQDMKWITNWQYSLGINRLCPHAFFYSIEGYRKFDAPPCHMHNLSWRYFRHFADYVARISYLLSEGRHRADVAVLYPLSEFQSSYVAGLQKEDDTAISDAFDLACSLLLKQHCDYDIMGEHHLMDAQLETGSLRVHEESFRLLAVPTLGRLADEHLGRIRDFARAGGAVWFFTTPEGIERVAEKWSSTEKEMYNWIDISSLRSSAPPDETVVSASEAFRRCLEPDVVIRGVDNDRIYYHHRQTDDEDLYFFANCSNEIAVEARISVKSTGEAVVYDCETGAVSRLLACELRGNTTEFDHRFEPGSSLMVGIRRGAACGRPEAVGDAVQLEISERAGEPRTPKSSGQHAGIGGAEQPQVIAVLPTDGWRFALESPNALPLTDWAFSIRPGAMGTSYRYETAVSIGEGVSDLKLMLDDVENRGAFMGSMDLQVRVNGKTAGGPTGYYIDKRFKTWDISHLAVQGVNTIQIAIKHSAWSGEPHLMTSVPVLLGKFKVCGSSGEQRIEKPDSELSLGLWTDKGYPFLSGSAVYSREFMLDGGFSSVSLRFGGVHEYLEVHVNGVHAGDLVWRPWAMDITPYTKEGINHIELRVTNTLMNILLRTPRPSGIRGPITVLGCRCSG